MPARLRDMNPTVALAHCADITWKEWSLMESKDVIDLWIVFRSYIHDGYRESDIQVSPKISDVWLRCKAIIDMEAEKEAVSDIPDDMEEETPPETEVEEDASFVDVEESGHDD